MEIVATYILLNDKTCKLVKVHKVQNGIMNLYFIEEQSRPLEKISEDRFRYMQKGGI